MADNDMRAEERDILGKFERGELRASAGAEQEMKAAREAARNTFNKSKRVNLRMTERDFNLAHSASQRGRGAIPNVVIKRHSQVPVGGD